MWVHNEQNASVKDTKDPGKQDSVLKWSSPLWARSGFHQETAHRMKWRKHYFLLCLLAAFELLFLRPFMAWLRTSFRSPWSRLRAGLVILTNCQPCMGLGMLDDDTRHIIVQNSSCKDETAFEHCSIRDAILSPTWLLSSSIHNDQWASG
jgi:hypothetical protein